MLGDSLLVAPVFKESGEVEYYLPEGTWYNLLTGESAEGGRWRKETYDYSSLPLMVRPGSILAAGAHTERPDYAFYEGVKLLVYLPEDQGTAETEVTDLDGNVVMRVYAKREGNAVKIRVDSEYRDYQIQMLGKEALCVEEME